VSLNANALVTLNAAKAFIQPGGMTANDDPRLEEVINRASSLIERWCGRPLMKATHTTRLTSPNRAELFLLHTPIAASQPITVTLNGTALTVWQTEADGDPATKDVILMASCEDPTFTPDVLWRRYGWCWWGSSTNSTSFMPTPANLLVTYSGGWALPPGVSGYPTIPADLEEAALEVVKKLWNDQSKGVQDVTTVTMPSGSLNLFDNALPRRATMTLESYQRVVVA
jgi:hypothetical protein